MGVPKKKQGGKKKPARASQQLTADEHYENAEMAFTMENFDRARTSFKRALDLEPENVEFLEGYGSFLAEVGPRPEALAVLQKAVQLEPEEGFEKFMYLGQLLEGAEAEQHVRKGITILRQHVQEQAATLAAAEGNNKAEEEIAMKEHLSGMLASALCSLVEVLMNQAEEAGEGGLAGVEAECEALLGEARVLAPSSPDPLQAMASLRQQQGKENEALVLLRHSLSLWFRPCPPSESESEEEGQGDEDAAAIRAAGKAADRAARKAAATAAGKGTGKVGADEQEEETEEEEEAAEEEEVESDSEMDLEFRGAEIMPSYEFRFEAAKLLLELDESVDIASQVLEQLLEENDSDPNVWLLLALCCQGGGDLDGALAAAEEGIALCKKLKVPSDNETLTGFIAMQTELTAMLDAEGRAPKAAEKEVELAKQAM